MRSVRRRLAAAAAGLVLVGTAACDALPPGDYPSADLLDDDDEPPTLDTRPYVAEVAPPPAPVDEVAHAKQWNDLFAQSKRAKYDRAIALRDAVARCYGKLADPKSGGSPKLAQAICSGGIAPKTTPLGSASAAPPTRIEAPVVLAARAPDLPPPFDAHAARAALRSLDLESCAPNAPGAFVDANVTFAASGKVDDVVLSLPSAPSPDERACVGRKTSMIRLPAFEGAPAHVKFTWYRGIATR